MYEINDMLGANSGLLCFNNAGNFGECRDYMELYRYYLQYPGRTTAALRAFMKGCLVSVMESHTFRDLYRDYESAAPQTTDINWYDGQIGLGYEYYQGEKLSYLGIKLKPGEENPPSMMPNTNCKDRGGTIRLDDYGLRPLELAGKPGEIISVPLSMEKCCGMQQLGFSIRFDPSVFAFAGMDLQNSVLSGYEHRVEQLEGGINVVLWTMGNLSDRPCGQLLQLRLKVLEGTPAGNYALSLFPLMDRAGNPTGSFLDKQGNAMSISLVSQRDKYHMTGGWSGVYQEVESSGWQLNMAASDEELADLTLLSGGVRVF